MSSGWTRYRLHARPSLFILLILVNCAKTLQIKKWIHIDSASLAWSIGQRQTELARKNQPLVSLKVTPNMILKHKAKVEIVQAYVLCRLTLISLCTIAHWVASNKVMISLSHFELIKFSKLSRVPWIVYIMEVNLSRNAVPG